MTFRHRVWLVGIAWVGVIASIHAEDWPHWRGPTASGVSAEQTLPTRWSATDNVAWKAQLAGLGISTPVVSGDRVFVTLRAGVGVE